MSVEQRERKIQALGRPSNTITIKGMSRLFFDNFERQSDLAFPIASEFEPQNPNMKLFGLQRE